MKAFLFRFPEAPQPRRGEAEPSSPCLSAGNNADSEAKCFSHLKLGLEEKGCLSDQPPLVIVNEPGPRCPPERPAIGGQTAANEICHHSLIHEALLLSSSTQPGGSALPLCSRDSLFSLNSSASPELLLIKRSGSPWDTNVSSVFLEPEGSCVSQPPFCSRVGPSAESRDSWTLLGDRVRHTLNPGP